MKSAAHSTKETHLFQSIHTRQSLFWGKLPMGVGGAKQRTNKPRVDPGTVLSSPTPRLSHSRDPRPRCPSNTSPPQAPLAVSFAAFLFSFPFSGIPGVCGLATDPRILALEKRVSNY